MIHVFCKKVRCRAYLFSFVDEGMDNIILLRWGGYSCSLSTYLHLVFQHKRHLILQTFFISIYNRSVIPIFTPSKLEEIESLDLHLQSNTLETVFTHHKVSSSPNKLCKFFKCSDLISSSTKAWEGAILVQKHFQETFLVDATWMLQTSDWVPEACASDSEACAVMWTKLSPSINNVFCIFNNLPLYSVRWVYSWITIECNLKRVNKI